MKPFKNSILFQAIFLKNCLHLIYINFSFFFFFKETQVTLLFTWFSDISLGRYWHVFMRPLLHFTGLLFFFFSPTIDEFGLYS